MAYGLEVRNTSGTVIFDSSSVTWIQIGFFTTTTSGGSAVYPGAEEFSEIITQVWFINTPPDDQEAYSHTITITTNANDVTVSAASGNQIQGVLVLGR